MSVNACNGTIQVQDMPAPLARFMGLLHKAYITNPEEQLINTIIRRFSARLFVCSTPKLALDLYEDAKLVPTTDDRLAVKSETGVLINVPISMDSNSYVLTGLDKDGKPVILKVLDSSQSAHEVAIIKMLGQLNCPPAIPSMRIVETPKSGHNNGTFQAIIMPHFVYTLVDVGKIEEELLMEKVEDIRIALQFIHDQGYVHMDVKSSNIMIAHDGSWKLIDYETMVKKGENIRGYTKQFYPGELIIPKAEEKYDWYTLLITILVETTKPNCWRDIIINEETNRVDRDKVHSAISSIQFTPLRVLCESLEQL